MNDWFRHIPFLIAHRWRRSINLQRGPLVRGNLLVIASLLLAYRWSGFPACHENSLLALPVLMAMGGMTDTARCMRTRWDFYHGGVLLLLYADLMVLVLELFMFLSPYGFNAAHL